jgi:hypothetical protein
MTVSLQFCAAFSKGSILRRCAVQSSKAARALGLASAAAATPAQRTKRARAGGKASAAKLTKAQRKARAAQAGKARWAKRGAADETLAAKIHM